MTSHVTHLWRLLKWGRTLARHGALRGIERDGNTPVPVRRLARLARLGARVPREPQYAHAFESIGPAAVKLGQTLATRPDLVGEAPARDLLRLQDALPPLPFRVIRLQVETSLGRPLDQLFESFEEKPVGAASIAQVHAATLPGGRKVAVKVIRPGIAAQFGRDLETYEWAAAHLERFGDEARRLRPRAVIANLKRWTTRELDLRREAASASELATAMEAEPDYVVPAIDWDRTSSRVMTMDWIDGIKISDHAALAAAGHDTARLAGVLVHSFLHQAIGEGFFHADLHQGNLFVTPESRIAAIDFGIMGRIDVQARRWLAEILYGLLTGNYRRVAEIHFEAKYVPDHHNVEEFATALRAVGEPVRGKPVKELSVGHMLDGLFAITRDFDMETQPHLLLLQKTMVMVEGVATSLDPDINMWETAGPFVEAWLRDELGPEAKAADTLIRGWRALTRLPDLIERVEARFPAPGGAPPQAPLPEVALMEWKGGWLLRYGAVAALAGAAGALAMRMLG